MPMQQLLVHLTLAACNGSEYDWFVWLGLNPRTLLGAIPYRAGAVPPPGWIWPDEVRRYVNEKTNKTVKTVFFCKLIDGPADRPSVLHFAIEAHSPSKAVVVADLSAPVAASCGIVVTADRGVIQKIHSARMAHSTTCIF